MNTQQETTDQCNARMSRNEVEHFKNRLDAVAQGGSYTAYLSSDKKSITTFVGDQLATIISLKSRRNRQGFTTDERGSFWARGIDGRLYHGTHNGAGMYCRLRAAKVQS